ncbi:MAG: metal ABC transporter permease [Chthoniobacteraceae bacterium]
MSWLTEPFTHDFMQRALVGGAIIGFANGFLGGFVVLRRLALMADALSHSMLPGLVLGTVLAGGLTLSALFSGGLVAALLVALGALLIARSSRLKEDTALAVLYTIAVAMGLVLRSVWNVRVPLEHYLFGNILGLSNADLWLAWGVTLVGIPLLAAFQRSYLLLLFEPSVARSQRVFVGALNLLLIVLLVVTMVASVHAVGVILMLGLLIAPAATVYLLCDSFPAMLWGGGLIGAFGSVAGLVVSFHVNNLPSGAAIILALGVIFVLTWIFSPRYGVLRRLRQPRHFHEESLARWPGHEGHDHE